MPAHNRDNMLKINRLGRTRSIASLLCKIFGYKNIRLNLMRGLNRMFLECLFFCDGVGEEVILRGRTLGPKLGA